MMKSKTEILSQTEEEIIRHAIIVADAWGLGRTSTAKQHIEDNGYRWDKRLEKAVFEIGQAV